MIIVSDIDRTIANHEHRAHHVDREPDDKRPKDWEAFLAPHLVAKDTLVEGARKTFAHFTTLNYRIVFLTGRNEGLRLTTTLWLKEHLELDITEDQLTMRPPGNMMSPLQYKREQVVSLKRDYPNESFLFLDDDKYLWSMYAEYGLVLKAPECWESMFPVHTEVEPTDIWRR
ncbi:MAG: hypothetical protein H0U59_04190 [Gemmatimonadaceae bacterium]|nr:hypothetical protein [Gemmatimonadaceae bacterium]